MLPLKWFYQSFGGRKHLPNDSDDNGPQETETQNDLPGNWWLNLVAIQSEVAQPGNVVIDGVVHCINGDGTDVATINTWEHKGE